MFLICSVGGTAVPVVASLRHWKPAKVLFIVSEMTRPIVDTVLREYADSTGGRLSAGCFDFIEIKDPEGLASVVDTLRSVTRTVHEWKARGDQYSVATDFTGGTKCMSAGLALVARRWPCEFSYVGGSRQSKDGVGIVETGSEVVKSWGNPWNVLGYQAVEDAVSAFNEGRYAAAEAQLDVSIRAVDSAQVKRTLNALKWTMTAFAAWDRFEHKTASTAFSNALNAGNDLSPIFTDASGLISAIQCHRDLCRKLSESDVPTWLLVDDLIANASRRGQEQRFDDAVARLYRACEAIAQVRLREGWQIESTSSVPIDKLPEALRAQWAPVTAVDGSVRIALQDAYRLLSELGDEWGSRFATLGLADPIRSPLSIRNSSILAHGFQPVSKTGYDQLQVSVCKLRGAEYVPSVQWSLPEIR